MSIELRETPLDETESQLLAAAAQADRGEDMQLPEPTKSESAEVVETEENVPTEAELADPANKDRARDPVSGKFIKRNPENVQAVARYTVDAPKTDSNTPKAELSEFEKKKQEKAAKEEERKNRSWENLNREKEELAARRRELAEHEQRLRNPQQQRQAPQPRQFSSAQFFDAREDFRKTAKAAFKRYQDTGDETALDEFNKNDQMADAAEKNAIEFYELEHQENQQAQLRQHQSTWVQNMEKTMKASPELAEADSPISKELQEILKSHGQVLQMLPDGFDRGVELAQLRLDAKEAPTLRERVKALEAEKQRQDGLLSPTPGGVTNPPAKKTISTMNETELLAAAARMDEQ